MIPQDFIAKWHRKTFREKSDAQTWFLDLLRLVGHPDPVAFDDKERFTFEKPVAAAYGWPPDLPEAEILARLLALNLERSSLGG